MQAYCVEKDTISHFLNEIVIETKVNTSPIRTPNIGTLKMDLGFMHRLPKIFGNADPIHYMQMLPGIQTNAEYDAGLHIQGCENSHNLISIEGVPVYNASHLLGFFSTFNPAHFSKISITKSAIANDGHSRIGGILNMELNDEVPKNVNGEFSVGLISSQGTLRLPIGKNAAVFTSLRLSYLNFLYAPLLRIDDKQLLYSFGDINVSYIQRIGVNHTLSANLYSGIDNARLAESEHIKKDDMSLGIMSSFDAQTIWGNLLGSLHWTYKFKAGKVKQNLYYSGYRNKLRLISDYAVGLPSGIYDIGYQAKAVYCNWESGISIVNHNITPQKPEYAGIFINTTSEEYKQNVIEGNLFAKYSGSILSEIYYDVALKADLYSNFKGYNYRALNPYAMLAYDTRKFGRLELSYSHQHQYLFNCGFTSLGMPVEFWIGADGKNKPQYAHNFQIGYMREIFNGMFDVKFEAYYKMLYNQIEYNGSPLDILNKEYSADNIIIRGNGYNYGASIMLNKVTGNLTGWLSYSFGRAMRKYDVFGNKWFSANHERIHEINLVATYKIGKRWDIGGTFAYASGTPFTSVKYFYIMNNNILTEFGEHNANRLADYIRLDLSVNYDIIKKENVTAGFNLSIYNLLCRKNEIYYGLKISKNNFKFEATSLLADMLPSISFYYKF